MGEYKAKVGGRSRDAALGGCGRVKYRNEASVCFSGGVVRWLVRCFFQQFCVAVVVDRVAISIGLRSFKLQGLLADRAYICFGLGIRGGETSLRPRKKMYPELPSSRRRL